MRGTIVIIRPREPAVDIKHIDGPLQLDQLKDALEGGYLEAVPYFNRIAFDGQEHRCVAFCDALVRFDARRAIAVFAPAVSPNGQWGACSADAPTDADHSIEDVVSTIEALPNSAGAP
jgi:hypothetical protein